MLASPEVAADDYDPYGPVKPARNLVSHREAELSKEFSLVEENDELTLARASADCPTPG